MKWIYLVTIVILSYQYCIATEVPTGLQVTWNTFDSISLRWDIIPGASYTVKYFIAGQPEQLVTDISLHLVTLEYLEPASYYVISVAAVVGDDQSEFSDQITLNTRAPPLSGQQALTVDEQSIHISWDANPYLPGDYVMLYYQVLTLTDAVNDIVSVNVSANVSEYLVEGLESASVYVFVVVQWFSGQEGDVDNDGRFNSTKPLPPTGLSITSVEGDAVSLEWDPLGPEPDLVTYILEVSHSRGEAVELRSEIRAPNITIDGLMADKTYEFRVAAVVFELFNMDVESQGEFSDPVIREAECISSCAGQPDGDYQSCHGCHVYVSCSNSFIYDDRPCPAALVWDDSVKRCEYTSPTCVHVYT